MISIIIPTYNRWKYLLRAVNSVINQTFRDFECIIVDDCSTNPEYTDPNEVSKLTSLDSRIKLIRLPINMRKKYNNAHAQGLTRNEGIKISNGEWLAFLDDDDWWTVDKLQKQVDAIDSFNKVNTRVKDEDYIMCFTNGVKYFNQQNLQYFHNPHLPLPQKITYETIKDINYVINSSVLIRRDIVEKVGMFNLILYEDYDLWKRVLGYKEKCTCNYLPCEPTCKSAQKLICIYINTPLMFYDMNHGEGVHYYNNE
jgi:teichuronic acid biosynthesis glycosyltransferase TuaG